MTSVVIIAVAERLLFSSSFARGLQTEESTPTEIAYDRPSPELKSFLRKHFGLDNCVDQPNRFMVFKGFFGRDGCPRGA